ncbi:hypothetical protein KIM372_12500 [Bombiscardovia nodaiensis]|uniref:RCC1-like domain-containing protein n=1 Tax=Bombiscardovia nodaiensis TaxID=2932181 RepID=A0ABM8B9R1_9BIFI|nr:hypothetical protein KIM372_12500 [Bombiscardovia nodaiensis]
MRRRYAMNLLIFIISLAIVCTSLVATALSSRANPDQALDNNKLARGGTNSETVDGYTLSPTSGPSNTAAEATLTPPAHDPVRFTKIAAGASHVLALASNGLIYAWGDNTAGQLGNGTTSAVVNLPIQVDTPNGVKFTEIAAAGNSSYAIGDDHKLYGWGSNSSAQLGFATNLGGNQLTPLPVEQGRLSTDQYFIQVSAGTNFAVALTNLGEIYGWGDNTTYQLGDGTTNGHVDPRPVARGQLPVGKHYKQISASRYGTVIALDTDGNAYGWGSNAYGATGDGTTTAKSVPTQTAVGLHFDSVTAGSNFFLGKTTDNNLYSWGRNLKGQLGTGIFSQQELSPKPVNQSMLPAGVHFTNFAAGYDHSLALTSDDKIYAWGDNTYGELGSDGSGNLEFPTEITDYGDFPSGERVLQASAGSGFSAVLGGNSFSYAWGRNPGVSGNGVDGANEAAPTEAYVPAYVTRQVDVATGGSNNNIPHTVDASTGVWTLEVPKLGPGSRQVIVHYALDHVSSLGDRIENINEQTATLHYLYEDTYTVQFDINGADSGAIPNQTVSQSDPKPAKFPAPNPTKEHNWFLGWEDRPGHFWDFTEPVTSDMTLKAKWEPYRFTIDPVRGSATGGTAINVTPPAPPEGLRFTQVDGGWYHSLAIASDGSLYAWGKNNFGALGTGDYVSSTHPVRVKTPDNVRFIQVCAGWDISWALTDDGKVYSWGDGRYGMLGTGTDRGSSNVPVEVAIPSSAGPITQLGAGAFHCTALDDRGNVYVWGRNNFGQQATGDLIDSNQPHLVASPPDGSHYVQVSSGGYHSLALTSNHDIYSWGRNWEGQLANGAVGRGIISTSIVKALPGELPAGRHFVKIISGDNHAFAIDDQQQLYGFGWNYYGSLGLPFSSAIGRGSAVSPIVIHSPTGAPFDQIAARGEHVLAYSDGVLYSWGGNWSGQLGNGVKGDGIWQWETPASNQGGMQRVSQGDLPAGHHFTKLVSSMGQHSLAISDEGLVYAWGDNEYGQLGDGESGTPSNKPEPVKLSQIDHRLQVTGVTFDGTPSTTNPPTWNSTKGVWANVTTPAHDSGPVTAKIQWKMDGIAQEDYPLPYTYAYDLPQAGAIPLARLIGTALILTSTLACLVYAVVCTRLRYLFRASQHIKY